MRTPTSPSRQPGRLRLDFIDGVRGCAALFVVLHHVWQFSITDPSGSPPQWFEVASVFKYGSFAVAVFVAVSGYCLMLPALRTEPPSIELATFVRRRVRRILPPYYGALALSIVIIAMVPALREPTATPWSITQPSLTAPQLISHATMTHNWFTDLRYGFNPPLWTIALEFQIYFVFALVLLPLWRRRGAPSVLVVAVAITAGCVAVGLGSASPWMIIAFVLGMVAAAVGQRAATWHRRFPWRSVAIGGIVLVPVVTAASEQLASGIARALVAEVFVGVVTAVGLIALTVEQLGATHRSLGHRVLAWGPVRWLGERSYSLYLLHYPIVAVLTITWISDAVGGVVGRFALLLIVAVPLSLLASMLFYAQVERRFLNPPVQLPSHRQLSPQA